MSWRWLAAPLAGLCILTAPVEALAVPAFSRKYNVACNTCHVAFPMLNATGRRFREAGYRLANENGVVDEAQLPGQNVGSGVILESAFPLSGRVRGWAVERESDEPWRSRLVSEASLLALGNWATWGSFFVEAGASDDNAWTPQVGAQVGYHFQPQLNVIAGSKGPFHIDPFNTFREPVTFTDRNSDLRIMGEDLARPTLDIYGMVSRFYYSAALESGPDNILGARPRLGFARLAYNFGGYSAVGAFAWGGRTLGAGPGQEVLRTGADASIEIQDLYVTALAAYLVEPAEMGHSHDFTGCAEFLYNLSVKARQLLPLLRVQYDTFDDRSQSELGLVGGLYFQPIQNARVGIEGRRDLKPQVSGAPRWGFGVNADVAF